MPRTTCTDVCDYVIDALCSQCHKYNQCMGKHEDISDESEIHEQLIECLGETFNNANLYRLM